MTNTYRYTDNLAEIVTTANPLEKCKIHDRIDRHMAEYRFLRDEKGGAMAARTYIGKIQDLIDDSISASEAIEITCKAGCPFCCNMQVHITDDEAMLLAVSIKRKKFPVDKKRLKKQSEFSEADWGRKTFEDMTCVFLSENKTCVAYNYRPMNCRKLMVTSPLENCNPLNKRQVEQYMSLDVKILATAVKSCCKSGVLPNILRDKMGSL